MKKPYLILILFILLVIIGTTYLSLALFGSIFAISTNNPLFCDFVHGEEYRDSCYMQLFHSTRDPHLCEKMTTQRFIDICWFDLVRLGVITDPSICSKISGYKDACYREFGERTNDLEYCKKIKSPITRQFCVTDIAIKLKDLSVCKEAEIDKDLCYYDFALTMRNSSICKKIETYPDFSLDCLALTLKNESYCRKIESGVGRDVCFAILAILTDDHSKCDEIHPEDWYIKKERCHELLNLSKECTHCLDETNPRKMFDCLQTGCPNILE